MTPSKPAPAPAPALAPSVARGGSTQGIRAPSQGPAEQPEVSMAMLMGAAQQAYSTAIQAALTAEGFGDIPRTGYRILGTLTRGGSSVQALADRLGMAKQAVGRLADILIERGYLSRNPDPVDRRRVVLTLTAKGATATEVGRQKITQVDGLLAARVGADDIRATRKALRALVELGRAGSRPGPVG